MLVSLVYKASDLNVRCMQNDNSNIGRKKRVNDFPERQVGYPERNDVSNPNIEMERIHVDLKTMGISKKSAAELAREMRGVDVRQA